MDQQDLFERILASLHDAALDRAYWSTASALIDEFLGAHGSSMVFGDGDSREDIRIYFAWAFFHGQRHQELEREYFEVYYPLDERVPRLRHLPDSQLFHITDLYTEEELKTSVAYNELLARAHAQNSLNVRLDGPNGSRIVWVVNDPVDGDGWSSGQVETIERLLPHLRQFVRVRQALVNAQALGSSATALLENTRCGIIQLDPRGRIVAANDRARNLLRQDDGLADQDGLLRALLPADDGALQALLARALPPFGGRGESGSMMLRRSTVSPRLVLHVSPVADGWTDQRSSRVAAIVVVVDPPSRGRIDPDLVAGILGLTPAESHVAVLLAQGHTIQDIATATGRRTSTIRWHIKHIFAKHGISRQVELVQLVLSLTDIPQVRG